MYIKEGGIIGKMIGRERPAGKYFIEEYFPDIVVIS